MKVITSVSHFSTIHLGDVIQHPVYGSMRVDCINKVDSAVEMMCSLLEFNNTLRMFDGWDMIRIKYGRRTILKVVK